VDVSVGSCGEVVDGESEGDDEVIVPAGGLESYVAGAGGYCFEVLEFGDESGMRWQSYDVGLERSHEVVD
jgi:hypothetical protein